MPRRDPLYAWINLVSTHLPVLRPPQATVLALWSFGTTVVGQCGRTSVAYFLAQLLDRPLEAVDQQLREFYCEAAAKTGSHRQELEVTPCFPWLVRWVLSLWAGPDRRLALALDATTLAQRFTVLALCLVYRGTAIPLAWSVLPAATPGAWKPHWLALLEAVASEIPTTYAVLVLADRGLYAPWLYAAIREHGWHPFLRINGDGAWWDAHAATRQTLRDVVPHPSSQWSGSVHCFQAHSLDCTLLARWDRGQSEPWLILTDLAADQAAAGWYALRVWIESAFRTAKRGAWQWQRTRMENPQRASRLWLVLALATLWTVALGSAAEDEAAEGPAIAVSFGVSHPPRRRLLSCVRQGRLTLLAALIQNRPWWIESLIPDPWPMAAAPP